MVRIVWEKWEEFLEKKRFVSLKLVDTILSIIGLVLSILIAYTPFVIKLDYVPDAVRGLTTLTSILAGLISFLINYALLTTKDEEIAKELRKRLVGTVFVIALGLYFVFLSYISLVEGDLVLSYKTILIGCLIMSLLFIDTSLVSVLEKFKISDIKSIEKEGK